MKLILGFSVLFLSVVTSAGPCEDMLKKIDPQNPAGASSAKVGQFRFDIFPTRINVANSCSFTVSNLNQKRRYVFLDDGSITIASDIGSGGKSAATKAQTFVLMPQEKGKNFSVVRSGDIVTLKMNAGDFTFNAATGKMVSNSTVTVQDTPTGVTLTNPQGLLVNFGSAGNARETAGSATLNHRAASCQFDKTKLIEGIGDKKNFDKNIRFLNSASQIDFVKKNCPGMKLQIATNAPAAKSRDGILNPEFEKTIQNLQDQAR